MTRGDPGSADIAVPDYAAALTGRVEGLVIGVPWRWLEDERPLAPATRAAFDMALAVFRALGAEVRDVSLPPLLSYHATMKVIAVSELFAIHGHDLRTRPELFGESLRYRIIAGGLVRAEDYLAATRARTDLARAMQHTLAKVDVMMLPNRQACGEAGAGAPRQHLHPAELHRTVQRQRQSRAVGLQRLQCGGLAVLPADRGAALRRGHRPPCGRRLRASHAVEVPEADAGRVRRHVTPADCRITARFLP
jgi:Amidase